MYTGSFHRSAADNHRAHASRTLGYDNSRGAIASIMNHESQPQGAERLPTHPLRHDGGGVAASLREVAEAPPEHIIPGGRRGMAYAPKETGSAMNEVMHGISRLEMPRRTPVDVKYTGANMYAALFAGESAAREAVIDDPFGHCRGSAVRKVPSSAAGSEIGASRGHSHASSRCPSREAAAAPATAAGRAYNDFLAAAASAPREADGTLHDIRPIIEVLERAGMPLTPSAAGTLIAAVDVGRSITFADFERCLQAASDSNRDGANARPVVSPSYAPPAPAPEYVAPYVSRDSKQRMSEQQQHDQTWREINRASLPAGSSVQYGQLGANEMQLRGALATAKLQPTNAIPRAGPEASSLELARLLNGDLRRHSRPVKDPELGGAGPRNTGLLS